MNRLGSRLTPSRVARLVSRSALGHSRRIHVRKELKYPVEDGLGDFLPPQALRSLAVDYQDGLLSRLNDEVKGTEQENKSVAQTIIDASVDPNKVLMFNYASEALNNSFFLENLKPPPVNGGTHEHEMTADLNYRIRAEFGSLEQLKSTFGATSLGMFSSGWVWLVCDQQGSLAVFPTFGTGTLLVRSRQRMYEKIDSGFVLGESLGELPDPPPSPPSQASSPAPPASHSQSTPAPSSPASGVSHSIPPLHPSTPSRTFTTSTISSMDVPNSIHDSTEQYGTNQVDLLRIGRKLFPLLCLSVHERSWISAGYGVWGKEEYVRRFWSVVDWEKVGRAFNKFVLDGRHTKY